MTEMGKSCSLLLVTALCIGTLTGPASARKTAQGRDAIMGQCIAKAHQEYPDPGESEPYFRARAASYKACMAQHGLAP
jgi:hypothetical protein